MAKRTANFLAGLKTGALHKTLGVKAGAKIPAKKLKIKKGMSTLEKRRIQFAINAKKWHHVGRKSFISKKANAQPFG
jgi:hypothetical protein